MIDTHYYNANLNIIFRFVTQIKDQLSLVEMESTKFECQLAPVGDPNMKVEWFLNGKPLRHSMCQQCFILSVKHKTILSIISIYRK